MYIGGVAAISLLEQCSMNDRHWRTELGRLLLAAALGLVPAAALAETSTADAERLLLLARENRLTDPLAAQAAELLSHDDPFVRGIAEWAIAEKVGQDNNTQVIQWPRTKSPAWFTAWRDLPGDRLLEADYVRQAVVLGIYDDGKKLLASVDSILRRARTVAAEVDRSSLSPGRMTAVARQLDRLESIQHELAERVRAVPNDLAAHRKLWLAARRAARPIVLANPAVDFDHIVFVTGYGPHTKRNITRPFPWKHKPGGGICVLDGLRPGGGVKEVLAGQLGPGHVRGIDLWWDAGRLVFGFAKQPNWPPKLDSTKAVHTMALRKTQPPMHLYEIDLDTGRIIQRTDHPHWSDFEPTYCADGRGVFVSDRAGRAPECGPFEYDMTATNLFVMSADGHGIEHLTDNKDYDRYPHSLDNGLIGYTHWEYQERHFMEVHSIWTVRPDGTMADALYKHHMPAPLALRDTRSIPGGNKLISIATGHHTFAYGPVVVVDPSHGTNASSGLSIVTPGARPQEGKMAGRVVPGGGVADRGGFYRTPWALSESCFLVAYAYPRPGCTALCGVDSNAWGIYLIDVWGNKELIYRDPILSCGFPTPLRKRLRPPVVAGPLRRAGADAVCYVSNVYEGMPEVERGSVRFLRISQHVAWPFDPKKGMMPYLPGNAFAKQFGYWSWSPVRVIGTVPVETDGSAYFTAPADTAVYFQALDENRMEIRRMRSMVSLKAGEIRGCPGCHEPRAVTPRVNWQSPRALAREPHKPEPPPWGADRLLGYEWLVQPVLDRHCIRCHGAKDPDGGLDFSAARRSDGFLQSFHTMFGRRSGGKKSGPALVSVADRFGNSAVTRPLQFGSHRSLLVRVLLDDELHRKEVKLSGRDWQALVTWIDANAPYHDTFFNKRPEDGGSPRRETMTDD